MLGTLNIWNDENQQYEELPVIKGSDVSPLVCYPIGSYFMSDDPTSPAELFGGTWEQLEEGRGLIAAGATYTLGSTGGNAAIIQTAEQVGSHVHAVRIPYVGGSYYTMFAYESYGNWNGTNMAVSGVTIENTPSNQPMNIMNPYYATYIWKRIE